MMIVLGQFLMPMALGFASFYVVIFFTRLIIRLSKPFSARG